MAVGALGDRCTSALGRSSSELWADASWAAGDTVIQHPGDHVTYVHPKDAQEGVTKPLAPLGKASGDLCYLGEG